MKVNTISLYRAHRKFWIAFAVTAIFNFLAIKGKKLWIWRKEKLAAAAAQVQIQQEEAPQNGLGMIFNNVIHNKDVISPKLFAFIVVTISCLGLSIVLSGQYVDRSNPQHIAIRFYIHYTINTLFLVLGIPLMLFLINEKAKSHVISFFWNEWAPDFIQKFNLNRVHGISN